MTIPKEFIGAVIGPGGKVIQEMQRETGSTIVIEEVGEFGKIDIVSANKASIDAVIEKIKRIVAIPEIGTIYHGVVKTLPLLVLLLRFYQEKTDCFIFLKLTGPA
jgi:polyribonucleotide nucleotidyltransferase